MYIIWLRWVLSSILSRMLINRSRTRRIIKSFDWNWCLDVVNILNIINREKCAESLTAVFRSVPDLFASSCSHGWFCTFQREGGVAAVVFTPSIVWPLPTHGTPGACTVGWVVWMWFRSWSICTARWGSFQSQFISCGAENEWYTRRKRDGSRTLWDVRLIGRWSYPLRRFGRIPLSTLYMSSSKSSSSLIIRDLRRGQEKLIAHEEEWCDVEIQLDIPYLSTCLPIRGSFLMCHYCD